MESIIRSLTSLSKENRADSMKIFKKLYSSYDYSDWLKPSFTNKLGKYLVQKHPEMFDVAIRLNVQVNLILHTLRQFGSIEQIENYSNKIGAFALTENTTGVLSGLHLDTRFIEEDDHYILNTPDNVHKNWISQGKLADFLIVAAKNSTNSKDMRFFIIDLPNENVNQTLKHEANFISNHLDLAEITLDYVKLPKESVLPMSVYSSNKELLEGIFYGRYFIAEATVGYMMGVLVRLEHKVCSNKKMKKIGYIDQLQSFKNKLNVYEKNLDSKREEMLETHNVRFINASKIFVCENILNMFYTLKTKFTTHMFDDPVTLDHLIVCKVAEGDTSVLRLSLLHSAFTELRLLELICLSPYSIWQLYKRNTIYIMDNLIYLSDPLILNILTSQ
jgi:hypothetical protein